MHCIGLWIIDLWRNIVFSLKYENYWLGASIWFRSWGWLHNCQRVYAPVCLRWESMRIRWLPRPLCDWCPQDSAVITRSHTAGPSRESYIPDLMHQIREQYNDSVCKVVDFSQNLEDSVNPYLSWVDFMKKALIKIIKLARHNLPTSQGQAMVFCRGCGPYVQIGLCTSLPPA